MSENGPKDADKPPASKRAGQLFGHRSGARPWDQPTDARSTDAEQTGAQPRNVPPQPASPYPRDATYTPRPTDTEAQNTQAQNTQAQNTGSEAHSEAQASSILGEVDDDGELTKLHPNYKLLMRIGASILGIGLLIAGLVADLAIQENGLPVPFGTISVPALVIALFIIIRLPYSRFNARGYQISRDRLRVVRGVLWRSDTIVPFGRVQHIDVDQGPIERALDLATLTLHTAGNHNSSVKLPGLGHELAVQMREEIRAHIKRESL